MKLFVLRSFETETYSTHTMFYATSMELAIKLAEEFYDSTYPIFKKYQELEKLNYEHRDFLYASTKKRIPIVKEKLLKVYEDWQKQEVLSDKWSDLNEQRHTLIKELKGLEQANVYDLDEYTKYSYMNHEKLYPTKAFYFLKTKKATIDYWLNIHLIEIETDKLSDEHYTDGD